MSDSEDKSPAEGIPSWQRGQTDGDAATAPEVARDEADDKLQIARRFLEEDEVKAASREKKIEFLKSKGVWEEDIQKLLGKHEDSPKPTEHDEPSQPTQPKPVHDSTPPVTEKAVSKPTPHDRPPIVTYPEFLTKPQRPPPLVTTNALLGTLYGFVGLSTLLYGTSKYLVAPMVDSLTDARLDLHDTAAKKLDLLVAHLEKNVSEVPGRKSEAPGADDASDAEDPTEMFHRDIGTQTTFPATPVAAETAKAPESESMQQATRLSTLTKSLSGLKDQLRTQTEDIEDIKALLDVFRDDLDGMTYGGQADFVGGYDMYGKSKKSEPEDEIRRVRDNIRRVKGVLLSTRNFPASTR